MPTFAFSREDGIKKDPLHKEGWRVDYRIKRRFSNTSFLRSTRPKFRRTCRNLVIAEPLCKSRHRPRPRARQRCFAQVTIYADSFLFLEQLVNFILGQLTCTRRACIFINNFKSKIFLCIFSKYINFYLEIPNLKIDEKTFLFFILISFNSRRFSLECFCFIIHSSMYYSTLPRLLRKICGTTAVVAFEWGDDIQWDRYTYNYKMRRAK